MTNTYASGPGDRRFGLPRRVATGLGEHAFSGASTRLMLGAGTHIRVVAERLGADPAVTLRVYSHVTPTMQREAAQVMDRFLAAPT